MTETGQKAKIAARIRALLALTVENGCTENEAMSAAEKAAELMREYQLSLSDAEILEDGFETNFLKHVREDEVDTYFHISYGVARFTETQAWYKSKQGKQTLRYFGLKQDADFAIWLCHSLGDFILQGCHRYLMEEKAKQRVKSGGASLGRYYKQLGLDLGGARYEPAEKIDLKTWKKSYILGAATRISARLERLALEREEALKAQKAQQKGTGTALVIHNKRSLVLEELRRQGIHLKAASDNGRNYSVDSRSFEKGQARGSDARFDRPIGGGSSPLQIGR